MRPPADFGPPPIPHPCTCGHDRVRHVQGTQDCRDCDCPGFVSGGVGPVESGTHEGSFPVYIPGNHEPTLWDVAETYAWAERQPIITLHKAHAIALIACIRECAMEAEIGHELSGFRVELLRRHGLTDSSDPAFGPVKYPDQGRPHSDTEPF